MRITIQSTNQTTHTRQTFQIFIIINILIFINFAHDVVMFFLSLSLSLCLTKYQRKTKKDVILSNQMNNNNDIQLHSTINSIRFSFAKVFRNGNLVVVESEMYVLVFICFICACMKQTTNVTP